MNCAWGTVNGWERALFFKPSAEFVDQHSYRFTPTRDIVAREVQGIVNGVGLMEVSGFNRFEIAGPGVAEFLDRMVCGTVPKSIGKVGLGYLLTERGNVLSEATLVRLDENRYWYGSAAASEWHDRDWLRKHMPSGVTLTEMMANHTVLVIAGPRSRELLQSVSPRCDWSREAFPWLRAKSMYIGHAEVVAMNLSFSGELAYELHVPNEQLFLAWALLHAAGAEFGLTYFGLYATESMRLEKGYRHWKADLIYEHNPIESGLDRFVKLDKPDFIGKQKLLEQLARGHIRLFVAMNVDCDIAPAHGGDPIYTNGEQVGSVTSGGYGHRIKRNIAFGFVSPEHTSIGTPLEVGILGKRYGATVVEPCQYDPENRLVTA